jgi:hypothetical protein
MTVRKTSTLEAEKGVYFAKTFTTVSLSDSQEVCDCFLSTTAPDCHPIWPQNQSEAQA